MESYAARMMALLRGFAGAHGTYREEEFSQDKNKQEIKRSAKTLQRPVTQDLWERHLSGDYHLGVITITEESQCWWLAVDVDDYQVQHRDLVLLLETLRVPALVCRTKSGGAHIYVFFSEPVPAGEAMDKGRELASAIGYGGSEVFPKQRTVAADLQGMGNWLNMPYFGGDSTRSYSVMRDGRGRTLGQFVSEAEKLRISRDGLRKLSLRRTVEGWEQAPPCLEHLASVGVGQGVQNNAMLSFGVLAKKMDPEGWATLLQRWNLQFFTPPHPNERVASVIKSLEKKDYNYKCHDQPCVSHCDMPLCRTRKFGIGTAAAADIVDSISVLDTEPPVFYVLLKTGGTVECDSEVLLSPRLFQKTALEQLTTVLPLYTLDAWLPQVQACVESATTIEAPKEVGTTGQLEELLERFCTDRHAADNKDELLLGKPWRDEETGRIYFRLRDLSDFLDRNKFRALRRGPMVQRIRDMGGSSDFFNIRGKGTNVWYVPVSRFTWQEEGVSVPESEESPL